MKFLESHRFWNIQYQEPFEQFLTEFKTRTASCNFQEKDRMMRDKIVFTVTGKLPELLLGVNGLTLEKAVKVCRAYERSTKQVKEFRDNSNPSNLSTKLNKVAQKPDQRVPRNKKPDSRHAKKGNEFEGMKINCKGRNHFKKVHAVSQFQNGNEEFDHQWLMAVNYKEESVNASLTVNEYDVSFQLDSDFNLNTICQKHVRKHQVSPTTVLLNMWNKTNMEPLGERVLMVVNPRTRAKSEVKFVVVPNGFTNL